ncbi:alpha amylase N-terminal ig-like domain-containing protein [Candidatus Poribacteria bacterium]|nr:alpha amylase N-terminal ig-like domain-containing protein [Candidatus Poribacteria bacterium]
MSKNRPALAGRLARIALFAAACALPTVSLPGPVPGVETSDKRPVEFPVPPGIEVWAIDTDEYLVTFRWKPGKPLAGQPSVAGTFNDWDQGDLPMEGPDADGAYRVTARIKGGDHRYKFVDGSGGWFGDPDNPEVDTSDHDNSILRLGITALVRDAKASRGDGVIEKRAILHDPSEFLYYDVYSPRDAIVRVRTLKEDAESVSIILIRQSGTREPAPMRAAGADALFDYFEYHYHLPRKARDGAIAYTFTVSDGAASEELRESWPLILDPSRSPDTPEWAQNAVWYQIMVDRFRDSDSANNPEQTTGTGRSPVTHPWTSDWYTEQPWEREGGKTFWKWAMYERLYGGDFQGVTDKLDYLKKLGVTAIYFNPVFEATNAHKYNARSYVHADDGYGVPGEFAKGIETENLLDSSTWQFNASDRALLRLVKEAHKRDMKIILDGVFNHLGDDALPFLDIRMKRQTSPFADWYEIESWEPFKYSGWGGFGGLPQFKKDAEHGLKSESLREYIFAVTRRWMDPNGDGDPSDGIDGWRLDVPGEIPKPFWVEWRKVVRECNPEGYISGEIWGPAEEWLEGDTFDAVMNYPFARAAFRFFGNKEKKISASEFDAELARHRIRYPRACTYALQNLYDSHDTDRWVSRLNNPDLEYDGANRLQDGAQSYDDSRPEPGDYQRLRLMALFQATYPGAPMIWYGTEVGMFGADDPRCRMPMWWDDLEPYDNPEYVVDKDLRAEFRSLFHLRRDHKVLRTGDFVTLLTADAQDVYAYLRTAPDSGEAIAVVLNNSGEAQTVELSPPAGGEFPRGFRKARVLHGDAELEREGDILRVTVPAISGVALRVVK